MPILTNIKKKNFSVFSNAFILNDGTCVVLSILARPDIISYMGVSRNLALNSSYLFILVDVNGFKKPNTLGMDIFAFVLTDKNLVPAGVDNESKNCDNLNVNYNYDCAAIFLNER